ncbi:MAG: ATP-binding protein, partial [bacterium]|nr:ATP-binding protein [bacterium]
YRIITDKGDVIAQNDLPQNIALPSPALISEKPTFATIPGRGEHSLRIVIFKTLFREDAEAAEPEIAHTNIAQTVIIYCGGSLYKINEDLEDLQSRLIIIGLITFLCAGLGGFSLSNRALRPINQISHNLSRISDTHLNDRIDSAKFDIELHPLVNQLNAALDRLEIAFHRERQFTADASHELRTPLSVIVNNIEVLLKRPRTSEEHLEVHQSNLRTAQHMQKIIEGLLTLSRIDAGQVWLQKKPVPLYPLVEDILVLLKNKAAEKQVRLNNEVDKSIQITVDSDKFKQALLNLIENAITYNRQNGSVTIKSNLLDNQIALDIIDTGIGIPPEHLNRIFERFYRVDPSRSELTGGCGLGLAIAKSIIELHQGIISVTSNPAGSIFCVILPIN